MAHCSEPLLGAARHCWNELENLVRHKCSFWQLLSRHMDDIAISQGELVRGRLPSLGHLQAR
jgi:hypothetical protein